MDIARRPPTVGSAKACQDASPVRGKLQPTAHAPRGRNEVDLLGNGGSAQVPKTETNVTEKADRLFRGGSILLPAIGKLAPLTKPVAPEGDREPFSKAKVMKCTLMLRASCGLETLPAILGEEGKCRRLHPA